jgi:hypothetical protein
LIAIATSVLLLFASLIGWAKHLKRRGRGVLGVIVFFSPIAICLFASLIGGTNMHGPFYLFVVPLCPVSFLG